jgi:RNA polymerase sigma factor (sigma-70 family)
LTSGEGSSLGAGSEGLRADIVAAIPSLRAFAVSLCGNPDRADDLVHDTLLKALGSMDSFTEGTNLTAWLFTILRNAYYSDYRKRRRETADPDGVLAAKLEAPAGQPSYMDLLDFREALQKLPADLRDDLPEDIRVRLGLPSRYAALLATHFPPEDVSVDARGIAALTVFSCLELSRFGVRAIAVAPGSVML